MQLISVVSLFVIYIMEPYLWGKSMEVMGCKYANKNIYNAVIIGYYLITVIKQMVVLYGQNTTASSLLGFVIILYMLIMTLALYKGKLLSKLISFGVFVCLIMASEMAVIFFTTVVMHVSSDTFTTVSAFTNISTLISKLVLAGCCYLFYFREKKNYITQLLNNWEIIPLTLLNALFELPVAAILRRSDLQNDKFMLMTCISIQLMLFFITFYIFFIVKRKNLGENKIQEGHVGFEEELDPLSSWKIYDYKKSQQVNLDRPVYASSEPELNKILENLTLLAKEKEVKFGTSLFVQKYYMKSSDICELVMSIVKRAIQMTCELQPAYRMVKLELSYIQGGFKIECQNSAVKGTQDIELQYSEGELLDYIVRKYNGESFCRAQCEANEYDTVIWYCCFNIKEIAEQQGVYVEE